MRIALIAIFLALAVPACAKKQKPAAAPATQTEAAPADNAPGGGAAPDTKSEDADEDKAAGDPCDGGEAK